MSRCKYRDCQLDAVTGDWCSSSHKVGYYRDRRATKVAVAPESVAVAPNQPATSEIIATSSTVTVAPLHAQAVEHILIRHDLRDWRGSQPYYLAQDTGLSHLSCEQLHRRIGWLDNQWQSSREYAERVFRLVHGLTAYCIPANMVQV